MIKAERQLIIKDKLIVVYFLKSFNELLFHTHTIKYK